MRLSVSSFIFRKLLATFVATLIASIAFVTFALLNSTSAIKYNVGEYFIGLVTIYFLYMGVIILLYGNIVSICIDFLQSRWFKHHDWLYVLLHGLFGLGFGILDQNWINPIYATAAALLFAIIFKWVSKRWIEGKSIRLFILLPIIALPLFWGYFQFTSPPTPPFTKEDAIIFATSSSDNKFPKYIGKWQGTIDGFEVERETSIKQIAHEKYIVTFTESWQKGYIKGTCFSSYMIERYILSAYESGGRTPPYQSY
ncbi:hypothetical protein [Psychrobacillus vulpis]|uniref:Uncharacterized protein n=1 Tax=Psychrobacillus vulpis TaxID=2325572 RepID=A0A544TIE0_9BACI|nr:hypothetical protein [Psychrobacillus vulpis]TQR17180.1 hypothetical protein FG384_18390 [Psychrobacillus vulpis]